MTLGCCAYLSRQLKLITGTVLWRCKNPRKVKGWGHLNHHQGLSTTMLVSQTELFGTADLWIVTMEHLYLDSLLWIVGKSKNHHRHGRFHQLRASWTANIQHVPSSITPALIQLLGCSPYSSYVWLRPQGPIFTTVGCMATTMTCDPCHQIPRVLALPWAAFLVPRFVR